VALPIGFDSVLCAVEMSVHSVPSLYNAIALTHAEGCLTAFHVAQAWKEQDVETGQIQLRDALHEFIARRVPPDYPHVPPLFAQVAYGDPAQSILLAAHHGKYELIVVTDRAHNRVRDAFIEPLAHAVLRHARIPVLVTPASGIEIVSLEASGPVFHCGRILVAVDLDQDNEELLETATMLRTASKDPLMVFAVSVKGGRDVDSSELRAMVEALQLPEDTEVAVERASTMAAGVRAIAEREGAGMIVLQPEQEQRRAPGSLAYEVLHLNSTLVLCVPPASKAVANDADPVDVAPRVEVSVRR
jgi:nucleotide-binding universal stress UspA family protein